MNEIIKQTKTAVNELIEAAKLQQGDLLVVGCSTSEIGGNKIGTASVYETAKEVFTAIYEETKSRGIYLAAQCCEHLNRAIIIEKEYARKYNLQEVNVVPQIKAGGSFATNAYQAFENPVAVEHIKADAGMDIGDTLIGMHLKEVAVPLRLSVNTIGFARLVCARTRPKFIGGVRAQYNEEIM